MKKIYIVGGNGFARECYYYFLGMQKKDPSLLFGGFLGHGGYGKTVDYKDCQRLYMGEESEHEFKENEYAVIGAGHPSLRKKIYWDLKRRNIKFFTIYCETTLHPNLEYGEANVFGSYSITSCNVKLGIGNVFNGGIIIGHDVEVGDFNFVGPRSQILGGVIMGSENTIGSTCIILPNAKIGNNNKIAPLSALYKGCRNNTYMLGNPAVKIGHADDAEF